MESINQYKPTYNWMVAALWQNPWSWSDDWGFTKPNICLVVWNMAFIFHVIYGMSSFPLTNSYFSTWLKPQSPTLSQITTLYFGVETVIIPVKWENPED